MRINTDMFGKKFKIISKVLSWALFVILLIIAAFLLYYYIATKVYAAKGVGYEPKFSIYTIVSPSMTPNINVYDAIVNVKVNDPRDIKKGDVITFISTSNLTAGTTITHRVKDITNDEDGNVCYITKGDFNPVEDQACAKYNNIIGKVIMRIPQIGRIQFFLASKAGWLLCILIPALIIISKDILRITKLAGIKATATKVSEPKKKNIEKEKQEKQRKAELKRKLINSHVEQKEYYKDPNVRIIDKRKNSQKTNELTSKTKNTKITKKRTSKKKGKK